MIKVFVDGQEGTTGLQIHQRLAARQDIKLLEINPERRKDPAARQMMFAMADIVFLCLPDDAARESVALADALVADAQAGSTKVRIIDASTAHRTRPEWAYGLPELSAAHHLRIAQANRVAVPGCHATGFALLTYPLVEAGYLSAEAPLSCFSVTGYTGGGKKMIADYEDPQRDDAFSGTRMYALTLQHKHLPEMQHHSGLALPPLFTPILGDFAQGMTVALPLPRKLMPRIDSPEDLQAFYTQCYFDQPFVKVLPIDPKIDGGSLNPQACNGTNRLEIMIFGTADHMLAVARLDNLGKGASGAAVQCMNLMMGMPEDYMLL